MAGKRFVPPDDLGAVEIICGLMGSGKSFTAVQRVLEIVTKEARPVYTNLPINWRVMREYLRTRHGAKYADLVKPFTEEHFRSFMERQHRRYLMRERISGEARKRGERATQAALDAAWEAEAGPNIIDGPDAQWVPPLAVLVIDEAHHWFPAEDRGANGKLLQSYITMLRHHMHRLVVITQHPMQIDHRFRRLSKYTTQVEALGREKVAGVRLQTLKVRGMWCERWYTEVFDNEALRARSEPVAQWVTIPALGHKYIFRLYSSFTHQGGMRRMRKLLAEVRQGVGLDERGKDDDGMQVTKVYRVRFLYWGMCLGFLGGAWAGYSHRGDELVEEAAAVAEVERVEVPAGNVAGITEAGVVLNGRLVREGNVVEGWKLERVVSRLGFSLWSSGDRLYRWRAQERPEYLGTRSELVEQFRNLPAGAPLGE